MPVDLALFIMLAPLASLLLLVSPASAAKLYWQKSGETCFAAEGLYSGAAIVMDTILPNEWAVPWTGRGPIQLINTQLCLDGGPWDERGDGAKLALHECISIGRAKEFAIVGEQMHLIDGPYNDAPDTGLCIDVTDGKHDVQMQLWTCFEGNKNQMWGTVGCDGDC